MTLRYYFYIGLIVIASFSYIAQSNYRNVSPTLPELSNIPVQTAVKDNTPIVFQEENYKYTAKPLFDYQISGLVVHRAKYKQWYSITNVDNAFSTDLCVMWGNSLKDDTYKSTNLSFSQGSRFCYWNWRGDVNLNLSEISNNHLVLNSPELEKKIDQIKAGDQIKIVGKLVNVEIDNVGKPGPFDSAHMSWPTSTTREDTGAGACEAIYVEDVQILQKGHPLLQLVYKISLYLLFGMFFQGILSFILKANYLKKNNA